jgi:3-isopropylmalate dehydrogenase
VGARKKIAIIGGDGIGPSVTQEAKLLLEIYRDKAGLPLDLWELDLGADVPARRHHLPQGDPDRHPARVRGGAARRARRSARAQPRARARHPLRHALRLRPLRQHPPRARARRRLVPLKGRTAAKDIDFVVFRENTEGMYVAMGGQFKRGTPDEVAINEDINTRKGVERIIRAAFEYARSRGKKRLAMADKSNAMRHAHELWLRVFHEVRAQYPEIESRHVYVDALCLLRDPGSDQFDVVVTNNLFGDIVTDLGAALQGGLGMAASANVHASDPRAWPSSSRCTAPRLRSRARTSPTRSRRCSRWACCSRTSAIRKRRRASSVVSPTPSTRALHRRRRRQARHARRRGLGARPRRRRALSALSRRHLA